jgi:hypothetical protein
MHGLAFIAGLVLVWLDDGDSWLTALGVIACFIVLGSLLMDLASTVLG